MGYPEEMEALKTEIAKVLGSTPAVPLQKRMRFTDNQTVSSTTSGTLRVQHQQIIRDAVYNWDENQGWVFSHIEQVYP